MEGRPHPANVWTCNLPIHFILNLRTFGTSWASPKSILLARSSVLTFPHSNQRQPFDVSKHSELETNRSADRRENTVVMFGLGPFRSTSPLSSGLLWKIPWRLSKFQKRRQRLRLRAVDDVVSTVDSALAKQGQTLEALERWKTEMPTEAEMLPKDKYTMFDRKAKRYRKGIHSESSLYSHLILEGTRCTDEVVLELPKWTRVSQRVNPPGY